MILYHHLSDDKPKYNTPGYNAFHRVPVNSVETSLLLIIMDEGGLMAEWLRRWP